MQFIDNIFDSASIGLIISSILFGMAHNPLWGANTYIEIILGGIFGYSYIISGNNIFVPIAVHFLYDFATFFLTWYAGKTELNEQIKNAVNKQVTYLKSMSLEDIQKISTLVSEIHLLINHVLNNWSMYV